MSHIIYDAAVLIAADRNERKAWASHEARLNAGLLPLVPSVVVAQVSRSARQAPLRRFLNGCTVVPFAEGDAHEAGQLLAASGSADVIDAAVVVLAARYGGMILTGDPDDLKRLAQYARYHVAVMDF